MTCTAKAGWPARGVVGVDILAAADGSAGTAVGYDFASQRLVVNHTRSSKQSPSTIVQTAELTGGLGDDPLELIVLVDNALVESFLNRRAVISSWISEIMRDTEPTEQDTPAAARCPA